jgi:hypothetical protein
MRLAVAPEKEETPTSFEEIGVSCTKKWSGRLDLNQRLLGPEPSALAKLSHAPTWKKHFTGIF